MSQNSAKDAFIPGLIGNFNIPKSVIENKVDVLTFLELLVRKKIITASELDEVRASVVAHLNAIYPELELQYATPESMGQQAGLGGSSLPPQPKTGPAQSTAAAAFAKPMAAPTSTASFQPSEATKSFLAPDDKSGFMASNQVTPGQTATPTSTEEAPPEAAPAAEAPAPAAANKPLWVQAPPPKFIK